MGDLMHALPALTDACRQIPDIEFDWVVDEAFAEVPAWHPAVHNIYQSAHRRWKKSLWRALREGEFRRFYQALNSNDYDLILDAQNNVKSAFISVLRKGKIHGMDKGSVAELPAHLAYANQHHIDKSLHAITRQRMLFAQALGYDLPDTDPDFGLKADVFSMPALDIPRPFLFLVHNASWTTKLWPQDSWHELISVAADAGYYVVLPGGSQKELERAAVIADAHDNAVALPRLSLTELGGVIQESAGAICCDTGLAHLAAMIGRPAVTLYGPTDARLIGTRGEKQQCLIATDPPFPCAPCYKRYCDFAKPHAVMSSCMGSFSAESVWQTLLQSMGNTVGN